MRSFNFLLIVNQIFRFLRNWIIVIFLRIRKLTVWYNEIFIYSYTNLWLNFIFFFWILLLLFYFLFLIQRFFQISFLFFFFNWTIFLSFFTNPSTNSCSLLFILSILIFWLLLIFNFFFNFSFFIIFWNTNIFFFVFINFTCFLFFYWMLIIPLLILFKFWYC